MAKQRLTTEDYDNLVREAAALEVGKAFGSITAAEFEAFISGPSLEEGAAKRRLHKKKVQDEFVDTRKEEFEAAYAKWVADGKPVDSLRHARGGVIGIQGAG